MAELRDDDLGEAAREAADQLATNEERDAARRALDTLALALGEDDAAPPMNPGLPDDYEVLGVLGRGSGGIVYHARQRELDREVAVKVLLDSGDPRVDHRRSGEARRLAGLRHGGVVQIHDVGQARTGLYLTLELHRAGSLQTRLEEGRLNPEHAARLGLQIAEAVAHVHGRGVVHLDLKPANVLLDDQGNARVADFGLAREADLQRSLTGSGGLLGTPAYMAPEQARNDREHIGEATDVHGLGALLHACLSGRPPFEGDSLVSVLTAVQHDAPARLDRVAPGVPSELADLVEVAMAKEPAERYPSARALAEDLARFLAGEPIRASRPSLLRRSWRALRSRRRELASAAAAVLLTVLAFLPQGDIDARTEDERWLDAAEELVQSGEPRAAALLVRRMREEAPGDLAARRSALLALIGAQAQPPAESPQGAAAPDTPTIDAVVDAWVLPDEGPPRRLWAGTSSAASGEMLRIEGRGVLGGNFPGRVHRFDAFATRGANRRWLGGRDGTVEAGGLVEPIEGGLQWEINDREVWVSLGPTGRGAFLDLASRGLLVGTPGMLEARRCLWDGGGATIVMFAEARERGTEVPARRPFDAWLKSIEESLLDEVEAAVTSGDAAVWSDERRASFADHAIALIALGNQAQRQVVIDASRRLQDVGVDAAAVSEGLLPDVPRAGVTRTGSGLATWLDFASAPAPLSIGERMDSLPPPRSMAQAPLPRKTPRDWLRVFYAGLLVVLTLLTLLPLTPLFFRASTAGGMMFPAGMIVVASIGAEGSQLVWSAAGCACLSVGAWFLRRWAGSRSAWSAALFLVACVQFALVDAGLVPDVRVPLVLAFAGVALSVPALHPGGRGVAFARWMPPALVGGYGLLAGLDLSEEAERVGARALALVAVVILFALVWATTRLATVLQQEDELAQTPG